MLIASIIAVQLKPLVLGNHGIAEKPQLIVAQMVDTNVKHLHRYCAQSLIVIIRELSLTNEPSDCACRPWDNNRLFGTSLTIELYGRRRLLNDLGFGFTDKAEIGR